MNTKTKALTTDEAKEFAECEAVIKAGLANFVAVGNALLRVSDGRLYRQSYSTFAEYVEASWKMTARHAYRLCESAEIVKSLPAECDQLVTNEAQIRELAKVAPADRAEVLTESARNGKPTAKAIKAVVESRKPAPPPPVIPEPKPDESRAQIAFVEREESRSSKSAVELVINDLKTAIAALEEIETPNPFSDASTDIEDTANLLIACARTLRKIRQEAA